MKFTVIATLAALIIGSGTAPAAPVASDAIPGPRIPARTFSVAEYGAVGDGRALNTASLQKAITACAQAGGGVVDVPPGRYLTGPLTLASELNLHLERGATLLMSDDPANYPVTAGRHQNCITAQDAHDVAITGSGVIDGQGAAWWARRASPGPHRPFLVVLTHCQRVLVQGVTLTNSPMFHLVPQECRDVMIENIHVIAPAASPNTDGLDPSGWDFLITGCTFDVGDDCIALKPGGRLDPSQPSCRNITITNCTFLHGHGLSVGGQTPGGLDGLLVQDCTFHGTEAGIRLKASRGAGGLVQNLRYENLTMTGVKNAFDISSYYGGNSPGKGRVDPAQDAAQPVNATTPIWRQITISHVTATGGESAGRIIGLPEMPVSDVTLTDVNVTARKGLEIVHAQNIRFVNSRIVAQSKPAVTLQDAQVTGIAP